MIALGAPAGKPHPRREVAPAVSASDHLGDDRPTPVHGSHAMTISVFRTCLGAILIAAAAVLPAATSPAQGAVGGWDVKVAFGEREVTARLTISSGAGGALTGAWKSERGEGELSAVKFADGELTFVRKLSLRDRDVELEFAGTIEGDALRGRFVSEFGEADVTGTRVATAAADATARKKPVSPLVGTWDVTSNSQLGELKRKLVVHADLSGSYESEDAKWPIENLALDGDAVSFAVTVSIQGQELPLDFAGTLSGTKIVGTYSVEGLGEVSDVTAVKVAPRTARVVFETELGAFEIEVQIAAAPITSANFLRYVDEGFYDGGRIHRSVRLDNQRRKDILIEVIQGGIAPGRAREQHAPIALERTSETGLKHLDATISMARGEPDTARSDWFICIGDQPSLDFGGKRNADGQGFAAFGKVVRGMDVVEKIHASPTEGETLTPAIAIRSARRLR
jgi:peptidyl-prolyl cis-trans isomerase A (cyclophilin A)